MLKVILSVIAYLIPLVVLIHINDDELIITLPDGKIKGTTYTSPSNFSYLGFHAIPFAKPPVGELRFEAPQPNDKWEGILDATRDSKGCVTLNDSVSHRDEDEDCLYINVYTPTLKPKQKLTVLAWIYGGAFVGGRSNRDTYNPDYLIEENVVIVTFNYRLGVYGFLSTGDDQIHGNAGLKDQLLALKWTKKNVEFFGGDPEKITIFGQSAGGASVGMQLINKQSEGLYRAAILESGSAMNNWTAHKNPLDLTQQLVRKISPDFVNLNDTKQIKKFLKSKTAKELSLAAFQLPDHPWPVVEVESDDAFVTKSHYDILKSGNFVQVPIITGICSEESLFFLRNKENVEVLASEYDVDPRALIPVNLNPNTSDIAMVADEIRSIYLKDGEKFSDNLPAFADLFSDNLFTAGILKQAEFSSNFVPVYVYQFAYYGGRKISEAFIDGAERVGHAGEIPYIFNMAYRNSQAAEDVLTQKRLVKLWTNFAKYLNPTPEKDELLNNVVWPNYNLTSRDYLNINVTLEAKKNLKEDVLDGWTDVFETYGKKPLITY